MDNGWWLNGFSVRTSNLLQQHGIDTPDKLIRLTRKDVLAWKNSGRKTAQEIKQAQLRMLGDGGPDVSGAVLRIRDIRLKVGRLASEIGYIQHYLQELEEVLLRSEQTKRG